jgi:hypothetical protein
MAKYFEFELVVPCFMSKVSSEVSDSKSGVCKFLLYTKYFSESLKGCKTVGCWVLVLLSSQVTKPSYYQWHHVDVKC